MELSNNLVRQFAKAVNGGKKNTADSSLVMGTVEKSGDKTYVKIDGSDSRTPVASTTDVLDGERVTVVIKNHEAFITGNFTSPSARSEDVKALEKVVTDKVDTKELTAISAKIKDLDTKKLSAEDAELKFANIDFSNIGKAAMEYFFAKSGLIKDVTIGDATITGELVGVYLCIITYLCIAIYLCIIIYPCITRLAKVFFFLNPSTSFSGFYTSK